MVVFVSGQDLNMPRSHLMLKRHMMKRAQAAMEFLMTYGWAVLIILVAVSALAYFGILNSDKFLPERCLMPPGIACLGHKATTSAVTVVLQNGLGSDITIDTIGISVSGSSICSISPGSSLQNGDKATYTVTSCSTGTSGNKFKGDVNFVYTDENSIQHTRAGSLTTQIE